jgi:hypothetical protein
MSWPICGVESPSFTGRNSAAPAPNSTPWSKVTFREVGASGRRYTRKYILEVLAQRVRTAAEDLWETTDFRCQELSADLYLLTYTLRQGERITRRTTIWRRSTDGWKIVFHQGTIVEDA